MSFEFVANAADYIKLPHLHDFTSTDDWSICIMYAIDDWTDESVLISNWGNASSRDRTFLLRTDRLPAATYGALELYVGTDQKLSIMTTALSTATWYLSVVTATSGSIKMWTMDMSGGYVDNGSTWTMNTNNISTSTIPVVLGRRNYDAAVDDPADGDLANFAFFNRTLSSEDVANYLWNPGRVVAQYHNDCEMFVPLGYDSCGHDFTENGNACSLNGSVIITGMPPCQSYWGFRTPSGAVFSTAAVGAADGFGRRAISRGILSGVYS
jgi:hypothetical protein